MKTLRHYVPAFAALLVVLIAVQATDLVACADEAQAAQHEGGTHVDAGNQGAHSAPLPGTEHNDSGGDHESPPDCLCHVVFAPLAASPVVGARPAPEPFDFATVVAAPLEVEPLGLEHVPLA